MSDHPDLDEAIALVADAVRKLDRAAATMSGTHRSMFARHATHAGDDAAELLTRLVRARGDQPRVIKPNPGGNRP